MMLLIYVLVIKCSVDTRIYVLVMGRLDDGTDLCFSNWVFG